jgi:cytochrome c peroxidase
MRLGNVRYWQPGNMFWDRRAATLEAQATQPIQHPVEMGFDASNGGLAALLTKMQGLAYYPELFAFAFGDAAITEDRIQRALAQFQRGMVSVNSRWDSGFAQVYSPALPDRGRDSDIATFTVQENRGRHLFMAGPQQGGLACAGCHVPPTFALAANARSNGLDAGETVLFKSPSLKSVGLSSAFMHDGRFSSLEQVVEHYNSGVRDGPALDNRLRTPDGRPRVLNLAEADKAALAAFLRTLDDGVLAADPRFSSPFRQ